MYKRILLILLLMYLCQSAYSKPVVRVIYFKPADIEMPSQAKLDFIRESLELTEKFYAREMREHGYADMGFSTERDANHKIVINVLVGEKPLKEYDNKLPILKEIPDNINCVQRKMDDIMVIFLGGSNKFGKGKQVAAEFTRVGCDDWFNPTCIIPADNKRLFQIITHELGHAFDEQWILEEQEFYHRNDPKNIMHPVVINHNNPFNFVELSKGQADLLSEHPYFQNKELSVNSSNKLPIIWANIKQIK